MSSNLKIKRICAWCGKEFIDMVLGNIFEHFCIGK